MDGQKMSQRTKTLKALKAPHPTKYNRLNDATKMVAMRSSFEGEGFYLASCN